MDPDAATRICGEPPPAQRPRMILRSWRPLVRGSLRGFAAVTLLSMIEIDEVAVHVSGGRAWASLPARPMIDGARQALRDDRGKIRYVAPIRWRTRDLADRFSAAVVELVRAAHPGALDEDGR
jgi:hypothetical protein